jgi:hypothetical protein
MATYMTPTGEVLPAVQDGAATTQIGFGITVVVDGKPITLHMPDINAIKQGNFAFKMEPGERIGFDKLSDFYNSIQTDTFTFLPVIDWTSLPDPIKTMATFGLWVSNFQINIVGGSLKTFGIDVDVDFHNWQVPGIPKLQVSGTSLSILYDASSQVAILGAQPVTEVGLPAGPGYATSIPANT